MLKYTVLLALALVVSPTLIPDVSAIHNSDHISVNVNVAMPTHSTTHKPQWLPQHKPEYLREKQLNSVNEGDIDEATDPVLTNAKITALEGDIRKSTRNVNSRARKIARLNKRIDELDTNTGAIAMKNAQLLANLERLKKSNPAAK